MVKNYERPSDRTRGALEAEIARLRAQLEEAETTLNAIKNGRVDALVVDHPVEQQQVLVLEDVRRGDRLPIDRLRQGAVTLSDVGDVMHVNAAFADLLGAEGPLLFGRPIKSLVNEGDHAMLEALLGDRRVGPLAALSFKRGDGTDVRVHVACIPLVDKHGCCLIVTGLHDGEEDEATATVRALHRGEIDAVVVAEREDDPKVLLLGAAGRRYRALVENMRDGAVTLSPDGDILYTNPSFAAMIGVPPSLMVGLRLADMIDDASRPLLDALTDGSRGPESQAEVSINRSNGGSFRAMLMPLPPTDAFGVSLIIIDLTTRYRLDEAEQALRAIGGGEVDAFVVARPQGDEIQTLTGAHRPYRLMVERMQQGAVTLSATGDILYTNQPFAEMIGQPIAALIGTPLAYHVAPPDRGLLAALLEATHGTTQSEIALLHRDGGRIATLVAVALLPEEGGVCLIVTDLTRQKAYEAMVAAQALERSILEQAVDAIVLCDLEGNVIRASRAALDLCNHHNPLLRPFSESFALDSESGPPDLQEMLRGPVRGDEYTLRRAGFPDSAVLLSAGPVTDADGRARGCVITMTDITERRVAEDRLRESDRHKDEFLAILAHELRNPLAPIRTAVEILRTADLSAQRNASYAVEIIGRQSLNLIRLVDDLLDINRINQGKIVLQTALIDMRAVLEQAIETCRPLIATRKHDLVVEMPDGSITVRGDMVRLAQVVVNLLTNAANYTPPGGRIGLTLSTSDSEAVVTVLDNGIGIAPEMVARIFEPYAQASQSKDRATGGLGLGLTVCKRLMEMHGGSVEAHSEGAGRGARFVARVALAKALEPRPASELVANARTGTLRVLVVDDNRDAAESLAKLMQMSGHDVQTLANGAAAVANATTFRPDVVLLDIGMPGMNGYEVARRLRELPESDSMYLVAMTGYGSEEDRARSSEAGFDEHLVKPVDFATLEALLAKRL